jgi:hypothetical protein
MYWKLSFDPVCVIEPRGLLVSTPPKLSVLFIELLYCVVSFYTSEVETRIFPLGTLIFTIIAARITYPTE